MPAVRASGPGEAVGEDAAFEITRGTPVPRRPARAARPSRLRLRARGRSPGAAGRPGRGRFARDGGDDTGQVRIPVIRRPCRWDCAHAGSCFYIQSSRVIARDPEPPLVSSARRRLAPPRPRRGSDGWSTHRPIARVPPVLALEEELPGLIVHRESSSEPCGAGGANGCPSCPRDTVRQWCRTGCVRSSRLRPRVSTAKSSCRSTPASASPTPGLLDPRARSLEAYAQEGDAWREIARHGGGERVRVPPFDAVEIDLADLWMPAC